VKPVLVIGNPSADLDSFACAILYAYFYSLPPNTRPHIPILNVTFPARDLRRQRPEFATALAVRKDGYYTQGWEDRRKQVEEQEFKPDDDGGILAEVLTRHDLLETPTFSGINEGGGTLADAILVDWNSLAGDSSSSKLTESHVSVLGCVDHHMDEHFVPETPHTTDSSPKPPRLIKTAGSCTSLVLQHLQGSALWPSSPASQSQETTPCTEEAQMVQLALSAILIDTANLQNKDKVTDVDISAVDTLTKIMSLSWDRDKFYTEVKDAKTRGLELLTVEEVLGKDYKEWDIPSSSSSNGQGEKFGIASVVLPLRTLISRSSPLSNSSSSEVVQQFLKTLTSFAHSHSLHILAIMTTSTSDSKGFQRELLLYALTSTAAKQLSLFVESEGGKDLGLEPWNEVPGLESDGKQDQGSETGSGWTAVFWQREVSKSRKQVAPLLRKALGEEMRS